MPTIKGLLPSWHHIPCFDHSTYFGRSIQESGKPLAWQDDPEQEHQHFLDIPNSLMQAVVGLRQTFFEFESELFRFFFFWFLFFYMLVKNEFNYR